MKSKVLRNYFDHVRFFLMRLEQKDGKIKIIISSESCNYLYDVCNLFISTYFLIEQSTEQRV